MSEKLTQEGLLEKLDAMLSAYRTQNWWINSEKRKAEQAWKQIRELIENYNEVQAFAMEIIEGKRATKEWVYDRVDKELKECGYEDSPARPASYEIKGMIVDILTELGVELVDD